VTPPQHAYERGGPGPVPHRDYDPGSVPDESSQQTTGTPPHHPNRSWAYHPQVREMRRNAAELGDL
jgi:hypothetical protein